MTRNIYDKQIENRNFLSPVGFIFTLTRSPKIAFFLNSANIPDITLGIAEQPNYLRTLPQPGDKMEFGDLNIRFIVDENLENYMEIQKWMRGLGFPESLNEIYKLQRSPGNTSVNNEINEMLSVYSDGTLQVLNSNQNFNFNVVFKDMFPYSLSSLEFDATDQDIEYFTAEVSFKYTMYNIVDKRGNPL